MAADFWILDFIQAYLRSSIMDAFMSFITHFGDGGIFWIGCTLIMLIIPRTRKAGAVMALSLILEALCCNVVLKPLVARTRPFAVRTDIILLISPPLDYSFPSGHTGASFAIVSALFFYKNKGWIPAFILTVLIAFSRLYLYVHYPSDVLVGMLIGIATGWIANLIWQRIPKKAPAVEKKEEL